MEKRCSKSEERTALMEGGGGGVGAIASKLFFKKNWSQNNIYALEFLKIVFSSLIWAILTYNFRPSV